MRGHCWSPSQKLPLFNVRDRRDMAQCHLSSSMPSFHIHVWCHRSKAGDKYSPGSLHCENIWSSATSDGKNCLCLSFPVGLCINQHQMKRKYVVKLCKTSSRHTHFALIIIQLRSVTDRVILNQKEKKYLYAASSIRKSKPMN